MAKILVIGDTHFTSKKPSKRNDVNFLETQLAKLDYIVAYAKNEKVDVVCQVGDFFDTRRVSNDTIVGVSSRLIDLKNNGIPFITTLGQHDLLGHSINGYKEHSDLYLLEALGVINVLYDGMEYNRCDGLTIIGYGYGEAKTKEFLRGEDKISTEHNSKTQSRIRVAIVHASVGAEEQVGIHESIENQNIQTVDWAFFGDIHAGFDPYKFNNKRKTIAFSCGALTRMRIDERYNIPKFAIVDTIKKSVEFIEVPYSVDCFSEEESKEENKYASTLALKARLLQMVQQPELSDEEIILQNAKAGNYSSKVTNMVIEKL